MTILEALLKVEDLQTYSMGLNLSGFFLCVYVQKLKETFQTLLLSFDSEDSAKFTAISSEVNLLWCFVFLFYNLMLRTSAGTPQGLI